MSLLLSTEIDYLNLLSDLHMQQKSICEPTSDEILHYINSQNLFHVSPLTPYTPSSLCALFDGWKSRQIKEDGTLIFSYVGYIVTLTHNLHIISVHKSKLLIKHSNYIAVLLHMAKYGCVFQSIFLQNEHNAFTKLITMLYDFYIPPRPRRLRRSYNIDEYQIEIEQIADEGWNNRRVCTFDNDIHIIKFSNKYYIVYFVDGIIEYVSEYWS
jgi:hypothetical protein